MDFWKYFLDRLGFICIFYISVLFSMVVATLNSLNQGFMLEGTNILYAILLSTCFLAIYLLIDYHRKNRFLKILSKDMEENLENIYRLPENISNEYDLFRDTYVNTYSKYMDIIEKQNKSNKLQNEFNNRWIHEMKTPVSVMQLMMENKAETDENKDFYNQVGEELEKLSGGLEMALYTLRVKDFQLDFKVEQVELLSIVRSVVNENKSAFIINSVFPRIEFKEESFVRGDKKWVRFVISQIISNSIKYTKVKKEDKKEIKVSLKEYEDRKILSIEDTGVGIPSEEINKIFNPFFTGTNGRKYTESTGMGLYLVKDVVDKMGYGIKVTSIEGIGTKVAIIFYKGKSIYNI